MTVPSLATSVTRTSPESKAVRRMTSVSSPRSAAFTTRHSLSSMRPESSTVTDW